MAPKANIILVDANTSDDADLMTSALGWAKNQPGVTAISMSFGSNEDSTEVQFNPNFTTPSGHAGITFFASSGDSGAHGYGTSSFIVSYPASAPNVVGVGGTTVTLGSGNTYGSETAWGGSGGGISTIDAQPSYQHGVVTQSTSFRTVPDVAFDADPNSGVSVYDSYDYGTSTPWIKVGGTSLASPMWGGVMAVINQGRAVYGHSSLD